MKTLTRAEMMSALVQAAVQQAESSASRHPVDVGITLASAIEASSELLDVLDTRGYLKWDRS